MTKIKEASANKSGVKFKSANGKIIKAKHLEAISENMTKSQSRLPATDRFVNKCILKNASTPMAKAVLSDFNFNSTSTCRFPLSPILMGGNVRCGDNGNRLLSTIKSNNNIIEEDNPKKSLTKRKTFGMRRLFSAVADEEEKGDDASHAGENVSMRIHSGKDTEIQQCDVKENSLIRNLRNDWSSSTLSETLHKTPQPQDISDVFKKQPRLRIKRLLTPLVEGACEESCASSNKENRGDGNYSSAAEFESDDEKDDSRRKRAPTWKSLQSKKNESTKLSPPKVPLRRSRRKARKKNFNFSATKYASAKTQNNNNLPQLAEEIDESQNSEQLPATVDAAKETNGSSKNCQSDVHLKTNVSGGKKLHIKRLKLDSKIMPLARQSVNNCPATANLNATPNSPIIEELSNSCKVLQKANSVRRLRLRLRRYKIDSKKNEPVPQSAEKLADDSIDALAAVGNALQAPQELRPTEASPLKNQESISSDTENMLNEDLQVPTGNACVSEPPPHSSIYDDVEDNTSDTSKSNSKKFFHSRICPTPAMTKAIEKPKTRESRKRKKEEQEHIYDFLSQSVAEDKDPMADVIQKMISTGKMTLAKRNKHTGKIVISRPRRKREKKTKVDNDVFAKPKSVPKKQQPPQKRQEIPATVMNDDDDSHFDDFADDRMENVDPRREQGSFSGLARSTMIKQAGKNGRTPQRKMITDRVKLLELAKKIVGQSTPVKSITEATNAPQFSPIYGNKSPWRGDDYIHFPTTFYFGRNSDNMPSYSSDHIPMTQTGNKTFSSDRVPAAMHQVENKTRSVSSFSSNDSEAENIAPSGANENLRIAETPVLRRGLSNRSPLKSINIIDVVDLPPLAFDNTAKETTKENIQVIPTNKSTSQSDKTVQNGASTSRTPHDEENKTDLFGFEEIIDEENDSTETNLSTTAIPTKEDLKEKLQRLKRLRPEVPPASAPNPKTIAPVFDGPNLRQKSLRHMLCSTMIEQPRRIDQETRKDHHDGFFNDGCDADLLNLFKDPEPETTFNESDSRRTYSRLHKTKKRKVRNNFVMFLDSDASEEEEEDTSEKRAKKRHKSEPKKNIKELNKFVDEFNEMCKEVSQYQLIVE